MSDSGTSQPQSSLSLRTIVVRTVWVTLGMLAMVFVAAQFFAEPTVRFANWIVTDLGYAGIFLGVFLADALTLPIPPDTYLLTAVATDSPPLNVLITIIGGSLFAANIAYVIGPHVARLPYLGNRVEYFRSQGEELYQRYGVWTLVLAALSPIPFSVVCWFAGIYRMPYPKFFLATLARIPRFLGYYFLFVLGWQP